MEWQLIETAPRDGTRILAWNDDYGQRETCMEQYGEGSPGFALWKRGAGPLNSGWKWSEPQSGWGGHWSPTHWMPITDAVRSAEYWKAEHLAGNAEIERLRKIEAAAVACESAPNWYGDAFTELMFCLQDALRGEVGDDGAREKGRCSKCHRGTWDYGDIGNACGMTQPNGSKCAGIFEPAR